MFIKIDNINRITSITGENITKDNESFRTDPDFIWTDKIINYDKLNEGLSAFYNIETDEIYYEKYTEPVGGSLSETEEAILNTNINVEYLVALQELNL